jgi:pimeloyl-ACP methyl ester carboxylesterase
MDEQFNWEWRGQSFAIGMTRIGAGRRVLLLPALSSISTRHEMRPLQEALSGEFETIAVDMPGFGDASKVAMAWSPEACRQFVADVLARLKPDATIAAGHSAPYALEQAGLRPCSTGKLCLVGPTWRGPLPTMAGKRMPLFGKIGRSAETPLFGELLYRANVNCWTIPMMVAGHVYEDKAWLAGDRLKEKMRVVDAPGARHASLRFVTGELDLVHSREDFHALVARVPGQILVVYGAKTPRRSRAEIESLKSLPNITLMEVGNGKLSVYEEFPAEVAAAIRPYLTAPALSHS